MEQIQQGSDVLFLLMGAILVFAMHGGFAFLEAGTVRHKNQVNALVKILVDFAISTLAYFLIGYGISYGVNFYADAKAISGLSGGQGLELVKFFFLCTFAAAVPAIVSGGIAERASFPPQCAATALLVGLAYPLLEAATWGNRLGWQTADTGFFAANLGAPFHDFAGSIVVHAFGGWAGLAAVRQLGARLGRYDKGRPISPPPSSIPWLAMGSWLLCVGWFGFNVMSAQTLKSISGLVAANSLLAMCGGIIAALVAGKNDPGFVHNGALAGLVAVCAGSDVFHPLGALVVGAVAGWLFVTMFQISTNKWQIDDVLGVWALHGLCGLWGGIACGIFGSQALAGLGGVTFASQLAGSVGGAAFGFIAGTVIYWLVDKVFGFRLLPDEERQGADLSIHKIGANPEDDVRMGRV